MTDFANLPVELKRTRVLDAKVAAALCGYSVPHFRRLYRNGTVPPPIRIGERKLGWQAGVLMDYIERIASKAA